MKILETERLLLRTVELGDAQFYLELVNDPSWLRYIGDKGIRTLADAQASIEQGPLAMQQRLGHSLYLVELKDGAVPIGLCGLIKRDTLPDVDIGYAYRPAFWGRGYAYEAAAAVLALARDQLHLPRLLGITDPDNYDSIHLLQKLGLRLVSMQPLEPGGRATHLFRIDFGAEPD